MGFPNGLALNGLETQRTVAFRLPAGASVDSAVLDLRLHFARAAIPESNLQIFVKDVRVATALRGSADSAGTLRVRAKVPASLLTGDYLPVVFRSASSTMRDRCLDERLGLGYVELDPSSSFTYFAGEGAIKTIHQAWAAMPDTISLALPARRMTADEFHAAYMLGIAAANDGRTLRYTRLPSAGDLVIGTGDELPPADSGVTAEDANVRITRFDAPDGRRTGIAFDVQHGPNAVSLVEPSWAPLGTAPALNVRNAQASSRAIIQDPTFADLGLVELQREVASEGVWTLPLDLRDLPPGRVPSRIALQLVTAPNTNGRELVFFAFLNGTLVRSADINAAGGQQLIDIRLPASLIATRNELRLVVQRHRPATEACNEADRPMPAQVLPTSRVITTAADAKSRAFVGVTAQLAALDPLYLPDAALDEPAQYLDLIVPLGRAFWSPTRSPAPTFYGVATPVSPKGAFVVIGRPAGIQFDAASIADSGHLTIRRKDQTAPLIDVAELRDWSMAQVVGWDGHLGVQLVPAVGRRRIPSAPEAYGASSLVLADADSTVLQLNTAGLGEPLLFNDGPTFFERLRADRWWWAALAALLLLPPLLWAVFAVIRRTPRRELRRSSSAPGDRTR